jgi:MTH538 TIR-like domain (DUF1863).
MALFSIPEARQAARLRHPQVLTKTAGRILGESGRGIPLATTFDIFLSHSYADATSITDEVLLGVKSLLENLKYSVYVDWVVDNQLSRENVTSETANLLRQRMNNSRSLFFLTSANASKSKWMPWELGYMDGKKGTSAVLPILSQPTAGDSYKGQEYLGVYPYVVGGQSYLWIHHSADTYVTFENWLTGTKPYKH